MTYPDAASMPHREPIYESIHMEDLLAREWTDISSEKYREYIYSGGDIVRIEGPLNLLVSKSGGHRVFDSQGISHYIAPLWLEIQWRAKDDSPNFVA